MTCPQFMEAPASAKLSAFTVKKDLGVKLKTLLIFKIPLTQMTTRIRMTLMKYLLTYLERENKRIINSK